MSEMCCTRACLDQLLIAIRLFTLHCDHSRSKTRLIVIMNLIAKVGIIYAAACHASLCTTVLDCLSVSCHCHHTALTIIYKHGMGRGSESHAAAAGILGLHSAVRPSHWASAHILVSLILFCTGYWKKKHSYFVVYQL